VLDLESVRLFVLAAEFGNLTRAAEAAGTVQPVVSQRLKALEAALGRRLLERTPRFVRPTPDGTAFLDRARALLAAHDQAVRFAPSPAVTRSASGWRECCAGCALPCRPAPRSRCGRGNRSLYGPPSMRARLTLR